MKNTVFPAVVFIVSVSVVYLCSDSGLLGDAVTISPHIALASAVLAFAVCLKFNRSRISFIILLMLFWFLRNSIPYVVAIPSKEFAAFIAINLFYVVVTRERGVFSVHGLKKTVIVLLQLFVLYQLTHVRRDFYFDSPNLLMGVIRLMLNSGYHVFPIVLLLIAATKNMLVDKSNDLSAVLGVTGGLLVISALGIPFSGLTMTAAFLLTFAGVLLSIHQISYIDELTGLPGRRAYNEYTAMLRSKYSIAMADIDHFKKFNDTHGHDTGDEVLKLVAKVLSTVGGGGKPFRFGGEEFVIVFSGKYKEYTEQHLENLREKIEVTPFVIRNRKKKKEGQGTKKPGKTKSLKITLSLGAADSRDGNNPVKVMKLADDALYKSKKAGRNRVTV